VKFKVNSDELSIPLWNLSYRFCKLKNWC